VLKDVSFEIKKGETVGRNGSGKSTQLQMMATNLRRDTEQQNDSPSTKKSVIPAGIAGIRTPVRACY